MNKCGKINYVFELHQGPSHFARLGPGSTWSRVLSIIKPDKYTVVHGQCLDVGVGGFLLGGGVNVAGSTSKYGLGSENVVEYTMVSAQGEIVTVDEERIVKRTYDGHEVCKNISFLVQQSPQMIYFRYLLFRMRTKTSCSSP